MAAAKTPVLLTIATVVGVLLLARPGQRAAPARPAPPAAVAPAQPADDAPPDRVGATGGSARGGAPAPDDRPVLEPSATRATATVGEFVYLFDVSGSTRSTAGSSAFEQGASILTPALQSLRGLDEVLPSRHRVATIGTTSLRQRPLCDITVERPTLFRASDTAAVTRAVRACDRALRAVAIEPFTDIRGALHYAALSIRGERSALRGIVLVSDLEEDTAPGQTPATPVLDGVCVAVYTLVTPAVGRDPDAATIREREWTGRIERWGAKRVRTRSALGFDGTELATFFRSCEG